MPELDIPDNFKCTVETELIQNMQNPQILLKFTQYNTYWKDNFLNREGKEKKTSRCLGFLNNQQKICLEKTILRSEKLVSKIFMPKLGQKPQKSTHVSNS